MKSYSIIIIVISALFLCQCRADHLTVQQRKAQKKLRKAIKHDPNIIKQQVTLTPVHGVAIGTINDTNKGKVFNSNPFDCDGIYGMLGMLSQQGKDPIVSLYDDSDISIGIRKGNDGKLSAQATTKDKIKTIPVAIPYDTTVSTPGKVVTEYAEYPATHYTWFWALLAIIMVLIAVILLLIIYKTR